MQESTPICEKCQTRLKNAYWKLCGDCRLEAAFVFRDDPIAFAKNLLGIIEEQQEELANAYGMLAAQSDQLRVQQAILDTIKWAS